MMSLTSESLVQIIAIFLTLAVGSSGIDLNYSHYKTISNKSYLTQASFAPDYSLAIFYTFLKSEPLILRPYTWQPLPNL